MTPISRSEYLANRKVRRIVLSFIPILLTLNVCRAQSADTRLPPARPFDTMTIPLPQFHARFDQALSQRAKDMAFDAASYQDAVSHLADFVQMCSGLTVAQMISATRSVYTGPDLFRFEGGQYKECDAPSAKLFPGPVNTLDIAVFSSITSHWDNTQRNWNGPKLHVDVYFKPPKGAIKSMADWGKYYGILNADIFDGTTPAIAPPRKSVAEEMRESQEQAKPGLPVVGQFVCPGVILSVQIKNDLFHTFTSMPNLTVKQPTRIARVDGSGKWFQVAGVATAVIGVDPARVYYHIASGHPRPSCPQ